MHEEQGENHPVQDATHSAGKQPSLLFELLSKQCEGAGSCQSAQDRLN